MHQGVVSQNVFVTYISFSRQNKKTDAAIEHENAISPKNECQPEREPVCSADKTGEYFQKMLESVSLITLVRI